MLHHALTLVLALASFQDPTLQTPGPMIWKGELTGDGADAIQETRLPKRDEKNSGGYAVGLRAQLKALAASVEVQRDFSQSELKLRLLRAGACWSVDYAGKAEIAAEIAETRADWLEKLGRHADAVFAAWHPFVMPEETHATPYDRFMWSASNGSLAQLVNATDALPRIIELHKRFPTDSPASKGGDAIEEVVRTAIETGDPASLRDFGTRCVPALQKVLREGPEEKSTRLNDANDPLAVLLSIDRAAGESLILSTVGKRGPVWALRVIRALNLSGVTRAAWVSSADPYTPPRFDDPVTLQVIDALAAQPLTALPYFELLRPLVGRDVVSPAIRTFLLGQVQVSDPLIVGVLANTLDGLRTGPNKRVLYEAFLDSTDPNLRRRCAEALLRYPPGPATLRAVQHADVNVRIAAARALVRHRVAAFNYPMDQANDPRDMRWYEVARTPELEAALLQLAHDGESTVRVALATALPESGEAPPAAVLDALLADADAKVRATACWGWGFDPALQARVLERLAGDADSQVIGAVLNTLWSRSPGNHPDFAAEFERYLPALTKLLANPHLVLKDNRPLANVLQAALMGGGGPRAVFDVCVHGPRSAELGPLLLEAVRWSANNPAEVPILRVLEAPAVAELFALACTKLDANRMEWVRQSVQSQIDNGALDASAILALARDGARPREVRLRALQVGASKAGSAEAQAYLDILRGIKAEEVDPEFRQTTDPLLGLALGSFRTPGWPAAALAGFAKQVLTDPAVADMLALRVATNTLGVTQEKLDAAGTSAAVERWMRLKEGEMWEASYIFPRLDPGVDARVLAIWHAETKEMHRLDPLLSAMRAFPVDESIDLLIEIITRTDVAINSDNRTRAVELLARRLDERGADALLRAISVAPFESVRQKCFDGLAQIRKYQDEKQNWQKRKGGEAARDKAVADLLPLLEDKDPTTRAAAARSLATLRATEHLPKIVALLKDKDATVREAAQKAVDVLNTPETKKP